MSIWVQSSEGNHHSLRIKLLNVVNHRPLQGLIEVGEQDEHDGLRLVLVARLLDDRLERPLQVREASALPVDRRDADRQQTCSEAVWTGPIYTVSTRVSGALRKRRTPTVAFSSGTYHGRLHGNNVNAYETHSAFPCFEGQSRVLHTRVWTR